MNALKIVYHSVNVKCCREEYFTEKVVIAEYIFPDGAVGFENNGCEMYNASEECQSCKRFLNSLLESGYRPSSSETVSPIS